MHVVAMGFWGAFFGTAAIMLAGALAAFVQSHHRVALAGALTALASALFVVSYLGWLPLADAAAEARLVAHVGIFTGVLLWLMLVLDLGLLRERKPRRRILGGMSVLAALLLGAVWLLTPTQSVIYGTLVAFCFGMGALLVGLRSALRGDRVAWFGVLAITAMLFGLAGGIWIVLDRPGVPWQVHAASALAGMVYIAAVGVMLWQRYSYLIELREVLVQGPRYDPITRMQSQAGTGHMVGRMFVRQQGEPGRPVALLAVSIGNLYALENLHGSAALNHALFVCAGRLRRCVPADMEMGRLFEDGFLLVSRNAGKPERLLKLARLIARRLARPVTLRTSAASDGDDDGQAHWAAQVGVGLLATSAHAKPIAAIGQVRDMSRTAWSFASRVAWHDDAAGAVAEVPVIESTR